MGDLLFEVRGETGALPFLEFTLDQLFQRRSGHQLTLQAYHEIGGVKGALARYAESTYSALHTEEHRTLARVLFLRLIDPGATEQDTTRRRAALSELLLPDPTQTTLLQETAAAFIEARLLTANTIAGIPAVEVSHETLIREWPRLADWVRANRNDILMQQAISEDATEWRRRAKPADRLYRDSQLVEAEAWAERNKPSMDEADFLQASIVERQRRENQELARQSHELDLQQRAVRRQRYVISLMGVTTLVVVVGLIVGLVLQAQVVATQNKLLRAIPVNVTSLNDSGPGSLRQAINDAHSGDTITFARDLPGKIITLTSELNITKNLEINGPGQSLLTISGNHHSRIFNLSQGTIVTISNLTIKDGYLPCSRIPGPSDCWGAGIYNHGSLEIFNSTISDNITEGIGGGIFNDGGILSIADSTISDNATKYEGGGISNFMVDGHLTITNSTISGNMAAENGGGIQSAGTLTVIGSTILGNYANKIGGGIKNNGGLFIANSTISKNKAGNSGGISNGEFTPEDSLYSGGAQIVYCTIYDNKANGKGGGITNGPGNSSQDIPHIFLDDSIVAGNTASESPDLSGVFDLFHHVNLIQNTSGATLQSADAPPITGVSPDLGSLQNNGGPTQTYALLKGSPAIDAIPYVGPLGPIVAEFCLGDQSTDGITTDQRGVRRPQGKGCDLGAYEYVPGS